MERVLAALLLLALAMPASAQTPKTGTAKPLTAVYEVIIVAIAKAPTRP